MSAIENRPVPLAEWFRLAGMRTVFVTILTLVLIFTYWWLVWIMRDSANLIGSVLLGAIATAWGIYAIVYVWTGHRQVFRCWRCDTLLLSRKWIAFRRNIPKNDAEGFCSACDSQLEPEFGNNK